MKTGRLWLNALLMALMAAGAIAQSEPSATVVVETAAPALEKTRVVEIEGGKITGLIEEPANHVEAYKGIPFAAPPVGGLRWREPQPVKPWEGVRECTQYGNASLQSLPKLPIPVPGFDLMATPSEDCLYLNIWTSSKTGKDRLPVMVWIHGGAYIIGAASQPLYEGAGLARKGVVLVSVNYRLGALGFMGHAALSEESPNKTSGNYGIMDQIAALEWVKRNISKFGGDPTNVTIFGESAGGGSVYSLLVAPQAKGLFHRAIAESGPIMNLKHIKNELSGYPPMEKIGDEVAAKLGVADKKGADLLAALRAVPADKVLEATATSVTSLSMNVREDLLRWAPIVDGYVIPDRPNKLLAEGRFSKVPLIIGSNKDEGTMFTMLNSPIKTPADFDLMLSSAAPDHIEALRKQYPASNVMEMKASLNSVVRNMVFTLQARTAARTAAKSGIPVYLYQYSYASPSGLGKMMGAHHGAEIPYVFNNTGALTGPGPIDTMLREKVSGYAVSFAKSGNPNHPGAPEWPKYDAKADDHIEWGEKIAKGGDLYREQLDLLEKIMAEMN